MRGKRCERNRKAGPIADRQADHERDRLPHSRDRRPALLRLALALRLLGDPRFGALVTDAVPFGELPTCCPGSPPVNPSARGVRVTY